MLLRSLCRYTQTIIFSILNNSGRIFTLQLDGSVNILPLVTLIAKIMLLLSDWQLMLAQARFGLSLYWTGGGGHRSRVTGGMQTCVQQNPLIWFVLLDLHMGHIVYIFPRRGLPSRYQPCPTGCNFSEQMGNVGSQPTYPFR